MGYSTPAREELLRVVYGPLDRPIPLVDAEEASRSTFSHHRECPSSTDILFMALASFFLEHAAGVGLMLGLCVYVQVGIWAGDICAGCVMGSRITNISLRTIIVACLMYEGGGAGGFGRARPLYGRTHVAGAGLGRMCAYHTVYVATKKARSLINSIMHITRKSPLKDKYLNGVSI